MISEGQIVLFKFPQTRQDKGKLRPALILRKLPGKYNDWLICMISSQMHQYVPDMDEKITSDESDFRKSGLKQPSIIRVSRLAVVEGNMLIGKLGQIEGARLIRLKKNLCNWIQSA
jgi:mRNA interferase MazF